MRLMSENEYVWVGMREDTRGLFRTRSDVSQAFMNDSNFVISGVKGREGGRRSLRDRVSR